MERRASSTTDVVGQQSLLTALNRFVTAVNAMDDIVMIPSRLRDLETTAVPELAEENNNNDQTVAVPLHWVRYGSLPMLLYAARY